MNDYLCIGIIIVLFLFIFINSKTVEGNKKKKKKKKKEKKKIGDVLAGTKASCDITGSTSYSYASHIKTPKKLHMTGKGKSINKDLNGISAYVDLLTKGKSKASVKKKPLGARYFDTTKGVTCYDSSDDASKCTQQTAYPYVNDVGDGGSNGLISNMLGDLTSFSTSAATGGSSSSAGNACTRVVLAYATDACDGYGSSYVLNSQLNDMKDDSTSFYGGNTQIKEIADYSGNKLGNLITSVGSDCCGNEGFNTYTKINNQFDTYYENYYKNYTKPNRLSQLYILLLGIGGIGLLHQLMYRDKKSKSK